MKSVVDISIALIAAVMLLVPMAIIALLVKVTSEGPVLHWSKRMGKDCKPFMMPKFRTMRMDTPVTSTDLLENPKSYITPVGKLLRKASLDELPQLYSVICRNMSLVGPRPVLTTQKDLIDSRREKGIYKLRPGITGWAQINGRDDITMEEKVARDLQYLERQSLKFDFQIMIRTLVYVAQSKGIKH